MIQICIPPGQIYPDPHNRVNLKSFTADGIFTISKSQHVQPCLDQIAKIAKFCFDCINLPNHVWTKSARVERFFFGCINLPNHAWMNHKGCMIYKNI